MTKIVFFNCFHNGDVHVSRGLVRQVMAKVNQIDSSISFSYAHRNPANLLADIPELTFEPILLNHIGSEHSNLNRHGNMIFFNTWYAQQNHKYMNRYGVTFDALYAAFDDSCKNLWGFSLSDISEDPSNFFPIIDYSKFEIENSSEWLKNNPGKKILVENGLAHSDQAHNFPMTPIIVKLAQNHPEITFILTTVESITLPNNVIYSDNIIKKSVRSDLNEISFLSSRCDMVIGRASGVFSFTLTQENLFQRKIKYLCFSNLVPSRSDKFWMNDLLSDKVNYNSSIITTNEPDVNNVYNIIEGHL
jgi:hypothetical protein